MVLSKTYLREGAVVPEITLVGEAVTDEAELALLRVLLDGVQGLLLGDLSWTLVHDHGLTLVCPRAEHPLGAVSTHLLLGVGPAGDLDNHVQDCLLLIGIQRDVVKRRDGDTILLNEDAVVKGVGSADVASGISRSHYGG